MHLPLLNVLDTVRELGWNGFIQLTRDGLALGSLYALIALGYTLVYGILKLLNFAHGDVFMIGSFIGFGVLTGFGGSPDPSLALVPLIALMFVAAMAGSAGLGVVIERFAYRPLRDAPRIAPLISALGVSFFLQNSVLLLFGANFRNYNGFDLGADLDAPLPEPGPLFQPVFSIRDVPVNLVHVIVVVGAAGLMLVLTAFVARTRAGKSMRATAYDREAAAMMGIDTDRVIAVTFLVGSLLAGAAGVMYGLYLSQINHFVGFQAGLKAFTAAVVGGIGSIPGAMVGGIVIGLAESYALGYFGGRWSDLIVFGMLVFVLLVRPSGLLGTRAVHKV